MMERTLEFKTINEKLQALRRELRQQIRKQTKSTGKPVINDSDRSALAQRYITQQRLSSALIRSERKLEKVNGAIQRIRQGNYGICTSCGQTIQTGRLLALLHTELCVHCQEERENKIITT